MQVILASQSPRRRELLSFLYDDFTVMPSSAEEELTLPPDLSPEEEPELLARAKTADIASRHPEALVIGSDTVVIAKDDADAAHVLGKPVDREDAVRMLRMISGRTHYVVTGCALATGGRLTSFRVCTEVDFFPLTEEEIRDYVSTGEPMDKAGAYAIQGKGSVLIRGIRGDYFTVMGLPVSMLKRKIDEFLA